MGIEKVHRWHVGVAEAIEIQRHLAGQVSQKNEVTSPRHIAGADISVPRGAGAASGAVVVLDYPELRIVEKQIVRGELDFPYIPGLLSFREAPLLLTAFARLSIKPDLIMVDGQGIAHPRRLGIASHLGLLLGIPSIGCAKSPLWGHFTEPGAEPGDYSLIWDRDEIIGAALRTKRRTKPLIVSVGQKVDLDSAIYWVLQCCRGYRLPQPTRFAHLAAGGHLPAEAFLKGSS